MSYPRPVAWSPVTWWHFLLVPAFLGLLAIFTGILDPLTLSLSNPLWHDCVIIAIAVMLGIILLIIAWVCYRILERYSARLSS